MLQIQGGVRFHQEFCERSRNGVMRFLAVVERRSVHPSQCAQAVGEREDTAIQSVFAKDQVKRNVRCNKLQQVYRELANQCRRKLEAPGKTVATKTPHSGFARVREGGVGWRGEGDIVDISAFCCHLI